MICRLFIHYIAISYYGNIYSFFNCLYNRPVSLTGIILLSCSSMYGYCFCSCFFCNFCDLHCINMRIVKSFSDLHCHRFLYCFCLREILSSSFPP